MRLGVRRFLTSLARDYKVSQAFPSVYQPGRGRLVAVTGDNASGKSLFAKLAAQVLYERKPSIEAILVGMRLRTQGGIERAFIFGDEGTSSTGNISVGTVLGGIRTARGREHDHALLLDEPDIGLSEGYQSAVGEALASFASGLPEHTQLLLVVTHSRRILAKLLPLCPHHVRFGDQRTLQEVVAWVEPDRSAADLEKLREQTVEGLRRVSRLTQGKV